MTAPTIIHGPRGNHGMHFADRQVLASYQDHLYHDKPQLNFLGIPYRKPKRVIRLHTAGDQPSERLALEEILLQWLEGHPGERPSLVQVPGEGLDEFQGFTLDGYGYLGVSVVFVGDAVAEVTVG